VLDKYLMAEMPEIHDEHAMGPLKGITANQMHAWLAIQSGKVLIRPFDTIANYQPNQTNVARELMTTIKEITDTQL
jgi:hypothetical protein